MSAPDINEADVAAVAAALRSGDIARGPRAAAFEDAVAAYVGARHAVAVSSGTAALHLLVRAFGVKPGDEVLVPSFTFCASVNAILLEGAVPVFVDIEQDGFNFDPNDAERKITARTKAIMVVDVFGHPAEWTAIHALATRYHLAVIDDACEALGAAYRGKRLGGFGDGTAFAFYPNKQITTGEGGMVVTDSDEVAALCRSWRNHGRAETGFDPVRFGYNYSLDEMSAALGASQMARIDTLLAARAAVAALYTERLDGIASAPPARDHVTVSWFVYVVTLPDGVDRDVVAARLAARSVPSRGYFTPVHLLPHMKARGWCLTRTEAIWRRTLALPFHGRMTIDEVDEVVDALRQAVRA